MQSNTELSAVFTATYACRNCGNEWSEDHPPKTVVEKATGLGSIVVKNKDCNEMINADCSCCRIVTCPVCKLRDDVGVSDREPIQDGDRDD